MQWADLIGWMGHVRLLIGTVPSTNAKETAPRANTGNLGSFWPLPTGSTGGECARIRSSEFAQKQPFEGS